MIVKCETWQSITWVCILHGTPSQDAGKGQWSQQITIRRNPTPLTRIRQIGLFTMCNKLVHRIKAIKACTARNGIQAVDEIGAIDVEK